MLLAQGRERVLPAGGETDGIALSLQPLGDCLGQFAFVFYQQNVQKPADPRRSCLKMYKFARRVTMVRPKMSEKCKTNVRFA